MILVTTGTQFFDGLVAEVDRLAGRGVLRGRVVAQIGRSGYRARFIETFAFDRGLKDMMRQSELVISHGGTGTVCELIELGVPFIAVVNGTKADNHQLEFLEDLHGVYDFCWAGSENKLEEQIPLARPARRRGENTLMRLAHAVAAELIPPAP